MFLQQMLVTSWNRTKLTPTWHYLTVSLNAIVGYFDLIPSLYYGYNSVEGLLFQENFIEFFYENYLFQSSRQGRAIAINQV